MDLSHLLDNPALLQKLAGSIVWLGTVLALRSLALRFIANQEWYREELRARWHVRIGQTTLLLILLGGLVLWGSEIEAMALSAVAIAAALVLALREMLVCMSGSFYRAASDAYKVGDRIEIDTVHGDVISYGALTTTVLEIGPNHFRTGRAVVIPNSLLFTQVLINETITDDYVLHSFPVPLNQSDDWRRAEQVLLEAAVATCGQYTELARRHFDAVTRKYGLPPATVPPRITVLIPEAGKLELVVRVPTPARKKGVSEQAILRHYLEHLPDAGDRPERP